MLQFPVNRLGAGHAQQFCADAVFERLKTTLPGKGHGQFNMQHIIQQRAVVNCLQRSQIVF
ncbi:hypothetical protein D3C71_1836380 [compost metagenome]